MNDLGMGCNAGDTLVPPTRRRVLRLLCGALVIGPVALGHGPVDAKRKRKTCKRPCNSEERCVRGKCVAISRP